MKKYSDYKNSSVPWIGEIPTTWNLSQLRYVIECFDGKEFLLSLICVPICKEISRIGEQATLLITLTRHCLTKSLFS